MLSKNEMHKEKSDKATKELKNGLTIKVFLVFIVVLILLNRINHEALILGTRTAIDASLPLSVLGMLALFVILGVNWLVKRVTAIKYLNFSGPEMVTLYCMIALGALITCGGVLYFMLDALMVYTLPLVNDPSAIRAQMSNYREVAAVLESRIFMPTDPEVLRAYYLGLDRSSLSSVPWAMFVPSLVLLSILYTTIMLVGFCIATLVRKQWSEHEHMTYPLTLPVQALIDPEMQAEDSKLGIWKSKVLWAGVITSGLLTIIRIAHNYWPIIPTFNIYWNIGTFFPLGSALYALAGYPAYEMRLNPLVFGLGYLIPTDTAFTIVFVQFFYQVIKLISIHFGVFDKSGLAETWYTTISGGYIVLAVAAIIPARNMIREIWKKAVYNVGLDDSNEGMSYRMALFGLFAGVVIIAAIFIFLLKLNWLLSLFYSTIGVIVGAFSYARIRARTGLPTTISRFGPTESLIDALGTNTPQFGGRISPYDCHIVYGFTRIPAINGMASTAAFCLEAYHLGDKVKANRKNLTIAIIIALLISLVVGIYFIMEFRFNEGIRANRLTIAAIAATYYRQLAEPSPWAFIAISIAGAIVAFLAYMKMMFVWWPLDPLGFVGGSILEFGGFYWGSIFWAWLIKVIILRYGGRRGWVKLIRPYFIGIIIGYIIVTAIGSVLGLKPPGW